MGAGLIELLTALHRRLPELHPTGALDVLFGLVLVYANILALVPPPTRSVRFFRAALSPLLVVGWMYLGWAPRLRTPQERWGSALLFCTLATLSFHSANVQSALASKHWNYSSRSHQKTMSIDSYPVRAIPP